MTACMLTCQKHLVEKQVSQRVKFAGVLQLQCPHKQLFVWVLM